MQKADQLWETLNCKYSVEAKPNELLIETTKFLCRLLRKSKFGIIEKFLLIS